ncbi:MAG TPA: chemotaxis protein CheW [Acidobacteriaceae bacterium]|jgi:chemotaxis signal transduction protein|nr:chemotaxis protein CheW [Acidobacteriaceae bacterium]
MSKERATIFQRELTGEYREEFAQMLAMEQKPLPKRTGSILLFRISGRRFALPTVVLVAVTEPLHIAPIPHRMGTALLGLVAFEGEVLPCCALAPLLDLQDGMEAAAKTLILQETKGRNWAVPVDEVNGMRAELELQPARLGTSTAGHYIDEDGTVVDLLDAEALFRLMRLAVA